MGSIIKAGTSAPTQAAGTFQFDDMGNAYLVKVREEAAKIIAAARTEAEKIKQQAAEEGKKGAQQAIDAAIQTAVKAKVDEQFKTLRPALDQAVQKINQSRQAWQKHWETHALRTSLAIAERLCRGELSRKPDVTLKWIREALELASGNARVTLRLNPADHATLGSQAQALLAQLGKVTETELIADPKVTAGGCLVETEFGTIDQQLASQLARLDEELL